MKTKKKTYHALFFKYVESARKRIKEKEKHPQLKIKSGLRKWEQRNRAMSWKQSNGALGRRRKVRENCWHSTVKHEGKQSERLTADNLQKRERE